MKANGRNALTPDSTVVTREEDADSSFFAVREAMWRDLARRLPGLCLLLCVSSGLLGLALFETGFSRNVPLLDLFAAGVSAGLAVLALLFKVVRIPPLLANPAAAFVFGLALVQSILGLFLTAAPGMTTLVMLIVTGAGSFLLSRPWFGVVASLGLGGWGYAALNAGTPQGWAGYGLTLLLALAIGSIVQHNRLGAAHQFFKYKLEREANELRLNQAVAEACTGSERFQMFSEATLDGIIRLEKGSVVDANKAASRMFGMAREDLLGKNVIDLIAPEHRIGAKDALSMATLRPVETVCLRQDSSTFPVEIVNRAVEAGKERTHLLVFRNNSARQEMDQDRKRHQTGLEVQNRRLAGLARLATLPMEGDALPRYLDECLELASTCLPADAGCALIMWDALHGGFVVAASNSRGPANPPEKGAHELAQDAVSWVCANNEALMVGTIGDDSLGVRKLFPESMVQSFAAIPIRTTEGTFGVLFALQTFPRDWSRDDSNFLLTISRFVSNAAINSALTQQVRSFSEAGLSPAAV